MPGTEGPQSWHPTCKAGQIVARSLEAQGQPKKWNTLPTNGRAAGEESKAAADVEARRDG